MGYIFVDTNPRNTTSCGLWRNFQNLDVHNLFIHRLTSAGLLAFSGYKRDKKGEEFHLSPPLIKTLRAGFILRITLPRSLTSYPL